jgi:hypothetical protein
LAETPISRSAGRLVSRFPDVEVAGFVDRGLAAQRPAFLVVLLDRGVLVVDVQDRRDAFGDHSGAEPARGLTRSAPHHFAVEDQADLVGPAGTLQIRTWSNY